MVVAVYVFLLCLFPVVVKGQVRTDCSPEHNCLTCWVYRFHCNNCTQGYYLTRAGAYNTCKKCPSECSECRNRVECDTCKGGRWGKLCKNYCSRGCLERFCLKKSGICQPSICRPGFIGEKCDKCEAGKHGYYCNKSKPNLRRSIEELHPDSFRRFT